MKKTIFKYTTCLLLGFIISLSSCDWIDPNINIDPDKSASATMDVLLPPAQAGLAYTWTYASSFGGLFVHQYSGGDGQTSEYDYYLIPNTASNRIWRNSYAQVLVNTDEIIKKADELNAPHYKGVAQVLIALNLGLLTDMFGDIIWSEALARAENIKPTYDTQQEIYAEIQTMLAEAITNLSADPGLYPVGSDDFIYGGDAALWIRAANTLRARYTLHLSKRNATAYDDALAILSSAPVINNNSADLMMPFGTSATENAWIYQMHEDRQGYLIMGEDYVNMMLATGDPRLPQTAHPNGDGDFVGGAAGTGDGNASLAGGLYYGAPDAPAHLATYAEVKFMEAECHFLKASPDYAAAAAAYNEAVSASLAKLGVSDAAWEAANANESAGTITLETIMNGKYLALFGQQESWTDWRRTGYPTISIAANAVVTEIPRRMPYPDDEATFNSENVPQFAPNLVLIQPVWWDE